MFLKKALLLILLSVLLLNAEVESFATKQGIVGTPAKLYNGAITESYINSYMQSNGARQINAEVGRNGIDGLFYKKVNGKMEVYTIESKHNKGQLGTTVKDGDQMSKSWKLKKIDEKQNSLKKQLNNSKLTKSEVRKINKEINLLQEAGGIIKRGEDKALLFKMVPLSEEYKDLIKLKKLSYEQEKRLKYLNGLKEKGRLNSSYKSSVEKLDSNGKSIGKASRIGLEDKEIDLKKQYKAGSPELKQQRILKHTIRKQNRLDKEKPKLKSLEVNLKGMSKGTKTYTQQLERVEKQRNFLKTIEESKPKNINFAKTSRVAAIKSVSSIGTKTAIKGAIKGTLMSAASKLPIIGIAAQIAMDAYMMAQIEIQGEEIQINKENITANRDFIIKLESEQKILGLKVDENTYNINEIINQLFEHDLQFNVIDSQITSMSLQIADIQMIASKNEQEIKDIKDGTFTTGMQKLNEYGESTTNKNGYLRDAITQFDNTINIKNIEVRHLVYYYLTVARYEQYKNLKDELDIKEIEKNFSNLIEFAKNNKEYINLVNSAYLAISDMDSKMLESYTQKLESLTEEIINKKIEDNLFDDALSIAMNYIIIIGDGEETNLIYLSTKKAKEDNFEKNKDFYSQSEAKRAIKEFQNSLLNESAVKYMYNDKNFDEALNILRTKKFDDEDFRLKAFLRIYAHIGENDTLNKLVNLIIENPTYSDNIKKIAKSI